MLLSGCEQLASAQTLPVMDAYGPSDAGIITPPADVGTQENTLPNFDSADVGASDFSPPEADEPEFELPDFSPPPTNSPLLAPPSLQNSTSQESAPEEPESQNTPPPAGEDSERELLRAPTRGSGKNTPPDYMIRRRPKPA
ncbi:hypothetical protein DN745_09730 [Bradymonas sediminis]|uniref:Uncharacterized protein n=1 Tax=Bradymonas sediminis TaxID=1548548 RepID=A0A2Z4FL31_9DELT|nr:hypothetical protein DN745_09730 [Bradymonas sediminis]